VPAEVVGGEHPGHGEGRHAVAVGPVAQGDVRGIGVAVEPAELLGPAGALDQRLEGARRRRRVGQVLRGVEHDPVQVGVGQGVLDVGDAELGEVPDGIAPRLDRVEALGQAQEPLLADRAPQAGHAAEVGVHGHRRHADAVHQRPQGHRLPAGEEARRPLDERSTDLRGG
jgi:hypothetical protein